MNYIDVLISNLMNLVNLISITTARIYLQTLLERNTNKVTAVRISF